MPDYPSFGSVAEGSKQNNITRDHPIGFSQEKEKKEIEGGRREGDPYLVGVLCWNAKSHHYLMRGRKLVAWSTRTGMTSARREHASFLFSGNAVLGSHSNVQRGKERKLDGLLPFSRRKVIFALSWCPRGGGLAGKNEVLGGRIPRGGLDGLTQGRLRGLIGKKDNLLEPHRRKTDYFG